MILFDTYKEAKRYTDKNHFEGEYVIEVTKSGKYKLKPV